jgi:hypothetical protein
MLLERVHQIVQALINLCGDAQVQGNGGYTNTTGVGLAPAMARAIERFTQTLTALHTLLQAQSEAGMLSRILRHAETRDELRRCDEALGEALALFSVSFCLVFRRWAGEDVGEGTLLRITRVGPGHRPHHSFPPSSAPACCLRPLFLP